MIGRRGIYKSRSQLAAMRAPGLATAAGLKAAAAAVRAGITTEELDAIAEAAIREHGAESNFKLEPGYRHTLCTSVNEELVHGVPGPRVLQPGDLVKLDCGAVLGGWNGDAAVSVIVPGGEGPGVERRQRLSDVTREALWTGIATLATAKHLGEVGAAIEQYVESQGDYGISEDYIGHGIGASMHEEPPVFNYATSVRGPAVKPGLCVAIEPIITDGGIRTITLDDGWTVVLADGANGCQWEHSVAVHSGGIWVLTAEDGGASELARFGVTPVPIPDR